MLVSQKTLYLQREYSRIHHVIAANKPCRHPKGECLQTTRGFRGYWRTPHVSNLGGFFGAGIMLPWIVMSWVASQKICRGYLDIRGHLLQQKLPYSINELKRSQVATCWNLAESIPEIHVRVSCRQTDALHDVHWEAFALRGSDRVA